MHKRQICSWFVEIWGRSPLSWPQWGHLTWTSCFKKNRHKLKRIQAKETKEKKSQKKKFCEGWKKEGKSGNHPWLKDAAQNTYQTFFLEEDLSKRPG